MVTTQKRLQRQAFKLSIAAAAFACFGAVVVLAAPLTLTTKTAVAGFSAPVVTTKLVPLGSGPAITLARADQDDSEDCVRVTKTTGPDGKVYPTMGMVCGGGQ